MFPSQNRPGRGGIKPLIVPGHQAVDERQNDPRPLADRVAAFRRVPRFRHRPSMHGAGAMAILKPVLDSGDSNLQQVKTPQNLYLRTKNMFVAGFIGSPAMHFLYSDVVMSGESVNARIVGIAHEIALPASKFAEGSALANRASRRIVMGIRPEFFLIAQQDAGEQAIEAEILVTELVGPDAYLHFDLDTPEVELADVVSLKGKRDTGRQASRFVARIESGAMPDETACMKFRLDAERRQSCWKRIGAGDRDRTDDIQLGKLTFCH